MTSARPRLLIALGAAVLCTLLIWIGFETRFGLDGGQAPLDREGPAPGMTGNLEEEPVTEVAQLLRRDPIEVEEEKEPRIGRDESLLQGIVVTAGGEPIAGAEVELQRRDAQGFVSYEIDDFEHSEVISRTHTEADGMFSFTVTPLRQFALEVTAEAYGPELLFACYGGQYRKVVLDGACALEGTVRNAEDQSPIEGARVWIIKMNAVSGMTDNSGVATVAEVMTDVGGHYRLDGLPHTELSIIVTSPLGMSTGLPNRVLEPGKVVREDFLVEPGTSLTGTVRDAVTGQPIGGARVEDYPWAMHTVLTDERGQFEMTADASMIPVKVRAKGYSGAAVVAGSATPGPKTVDIELMPGGAVEGRILDPDGAPIAAAYVAGVAKGRERDLRRDWVAARTGADGRFRIEDLSSDLPHYLVARHPGYGAVAYAFPTQVQAAATVNFGDVVLRAASAVRGRVVDEAGNGLPDVFVDLRGINEDVLRYRPDIVEETEDGSRGAINQNTITDDRGVFRFGRLAPGTYRVVAKIQALQEHEAGVVIDGWGQVIDEVEILIDMGLSISGRVLTPTGEAPADYFVTLESALEGGLHTLKQYYGSDGSFEIKSVPEGTYHVGVSADGWGGGGQRDVAAGTAGLELRLETIAWIEGMVLDADGKPATGIFVYGRRINSIGRSTSTMRVLTGLDGRFRVRASEGQVLEMHVFSPTDEERTMGFVGTPDPEREVVVPGVVAGTTDLVIRLR